MDAISQFKVERSLYTADSGRAGGAQISVVTKSGSSQFHGGVYRSVDGGSTWYQAKTPYGVAVIHSVAIGPDSNIWVAAREGAFRSGDGGEHWNQVMNGLPQMNLASITNDRGGRLLATAASAELYESSDSGRTWHSMNAGWKVRSVLPTAERLLATTPYEGIVAQPATEAAARNGSRPAGGSER